MFTHPVPGRVTSPYGPRGQGFHNGVDYGWLLADPVRSRNVYAPASGVVTVASNALVGNYIELPTTIGLLRLAHFASIAVRSGTRVVQGQTLLGVMGETGSQSSGVHLHVDLFMKDGRVDPSPHFTIPFGITPTSIEGNDMAQIQYYERIGTSAAEWMIGGRELSGGYQVTLNGDLARQWGRQYSGQGTVPVKLTRDLYVAQQAFLRAHAAEWETQQRALFAGLVGADPTAIAKAVNDDTARRLTA